MLKKHVNVNFHDLKQMELAPFASKIVSLMTEHVAIFAKPPVSLSGVTKLVDAYSAVLGKSDYAGQTGDIHETRHALQRRGFLCFVGDVKCVRVSLEFV